MLANTTMSKVKVEQRVVDMLDSFVYSECEKDFFSFVEWGWKVIEPGRPFESNWHLRSICNHLDAIIKGKIKRLIVMVPPRTMKSSLVSILFPVWAWIHKPHLKFLTVSNTQKLAKKCAISSRNLLQSDWFIDGYGDTVSLSGSQNEKSYYENTKTGYRMADGIDCKSTGKSCDILICDDIHEAQEAMSDSPLSRSSVVEKYNVTLSTRLNDQDSAIIVIMQRLHEEDVVGHILRTSSEDWQVLMFPMEFEPERVCETVLGVQDIRTEPEELLWPDRFSQDYVDEAKIKLQDWGFASQHQQRPSPKGGAFIKIDEIEQFSELPDESDVIDVLQFWDTAQKKGRRHSAWVCGTWYRTKNRYYLVDVFRQQMDYPGGKEMVMVKYNEYKPSTVCIEDKSTGSSLIQELDAETTMPIVPMLPSMDKQNRMFVETSAITAGKVCIPEDAYWKDAFLDELRTFPGGTRDDQVDMLSMSLRHFRENDINEFRIMELF